MYKRKFKNGDIVTVKNYEGVFTVVGYIKDTKTYSLKNNRNEFVYAVAGKLTKIDTTIYNVGDRVEVTLDKGGKTGIMAIKKGMTGKIVNTEYHYNNDKNFITVEFDEYCGGHSGCGNGKCGFCWFVHKDALQLISSEIKVGTKVKYNDEVIIVKSVGVKCLELENGVFVPVEDVEVIKQRPVPKLESGMIVKLRNNFKYLVVNGGNKPFFLGENGEFYVDAPLGTFDENLKYTDNNRFDVMKIYKPIRISFNYMFKRKLTPIWERVE